MTRDTAERVRARLEDLEWLLEAGAPLSEIPGRLGLTAGGLSRWLYRHGRRDLGQLFGRAEAA